jgi:ABC-type sulfate transport system permease subunit
MLLLVNGQDMALESLIARYGITICLSLTCLILFRFFVGSRFVPFDLLFLASTTTSGPEAP